MGTLQSNPFASPASEPQANLMSQYPQSGVDVMPNYTPGQLGIMQYRQGGGRPLGSPQTGGIFSPPQTMGTPPGGNLTPPQSGAILSQPQTMGTGGTNAAGMGVGAIRPPSRMMPNRLIR
jgi:hypothetical protein